MGLSPRIEIALRLFDSCSRQKGPTSTVRDCLEEADILLKHKTEPQLFIDIEKYNKAIACLKEYQNFALPDWQGAMSFRAKDILIELDELEDEFKVIKPRGDK